MLVILNAIIAYTRAEDGYLMPTRPLGDAMTVNTTAPCHTGSAKAFFGAICMPLQPELRGLKTAQSATLTAILAVDTTNMGCDLKVHIMVTHQ